MPIHHGSHQTWTDSLLACYGVEEERLLLLSYIHAGDEDGSLRQKVPVPWTGCHPSTHPTPWHPHAERHHSFLQASILARCVALRLESQVSVVSRQLPIAWSPNTLQRCVRAPSTHRGIAWLLLASSNASCSACLACLAAIPRLSDGYTDHATPSLADPAWVGLTVGIASRRDAPRGIHTTIHDPSCA